jgi:hypothetical protein
MSVGVMKDYKLRNLSVSDTLFMFLLHEIRYYYILFLFIKSRNRELQAKLMNESVR